MVSTAIRDAIGGLSQVLTAGSWFMRGRSERSPDAIEGTGLVARAPGRRLVLQLRLRGSGLAAHRARLAGGRRFCGLIQRLWRRHWIASLPAPRRRYWRRHVLPAGLPSLTSGNSVDLSIEESNLQAVYGNGIDQGIDEVRLPLGHQSFFLQLIICKYFPRLYFAEHAAAPRMVAGPPAAQVTTHCCATVAGPRTAADAAASVVPYTDDR